MCAIRCCGCLTKRGWRNTDDLAAEPVVRGQTLSRGPVANILRVNIVVLVTRVGKKQLPGGGLSAYLYKVVASRQRDCRVTSLHKPRESRLCMRPSASIIEY